METQHTALIERYFDGLLSPEENEKLERLRETDEGVQQEFELFEKSHRAVKMSTVIDLTSEIKGIHAQMQARKSAPVIPLIRLGIAASVLCILSVAFFAQRFSNESLYEQVYAPVGDYVTNMDGDLSALEAAMKLYDQQRFDEATTAFKTIYRETEDQVALFYAGHSQYQAGKLTEAIETFSNITGSYRSEAQWYAALTHLKLDDSENALQTLDALIAENDDSTFVLKAEKLKSAMNSPLRVLVF